MIRDYPKWGDIITVDGAATLDFQIFIETLAQSINEAKILSFNVADAPDPATSDINIIKVLDEIGGVTLAFNDLTDWRRVQDRNIIST